MTNARPQEETGAVMNMPGGHTHSTAAQGQDAGVQLRRRRQAALRCEPLQDGRRDPWPADRGVRVKTNSFPSPTLHVEVGARTAWLYGSDGRDMFALLDKVRIERRQWDYQRRVWMIPVQYADDVMAWAEWKQRRLVTCEAVDR
jgi:hypothetical protein